MCGLERARVERVVIDAGGNRLSDSVFAVPIGGSFSRWCHSQSTWIVETTALRPG